MFKHVLAITLAIVSAQTLAQTPTGTTGNQFNPAISLILDGRYSAMTRDPATYHLPGFMLGGESGPGERGLALGESELVMSANIDDQLYGSFTAALAPEGGSEVEEAYVQTLKLGGGATLKAGRFLSHVGYLNNVHAHAWDFADQPLAYRAFLGNQYRDDGVQARWLAPTELFLELGAEIFRGEAFPAGGAARNGKGTRALFARLGGDVGTSHSWRIGFSRLTSDANSRATGDEATPDLFDGESRLGIVDVVWKWAPEGNRTQRYFKLQTELFRRDEAGNVDPASAGAPLAYAGRQHGGYLQAVYQFMPRWRVGARADRLTSDTVDPSLAGTVLDNQGHKPARSSVMIDFSNSEFSRLRLQLNRDDSRADATDRQWYLQYVVSLGAHGAHGF